MNSKVLMCLPLALLAGCFTLSQSEYPTPQLSQVTSGVKLQVEGFQATVIDYTPIYSTSTYVTHGGWYGPRHYYAGPMVGTYTTQSYMPTLRNTDVFRERAVGNLEKAGCILRASPAMYTVSGVFGGPVHEDTAALKSVGVFVGSVLSARFEMVSYSAEVKIYESATGRLVFTRAYTQDYFASGWSPIPLFGIMDFEKVQGEYMKSWCLAALTDRITADVTAFFSQQKQ